MCSCNYNKSLFDFRGETTLGPRFLQQAPGADPQRRGRETQEKEMRLPNGQDSLSETRRRVGCFSAVYSVFAPSCPVIHFLRFALRLPSCLSLQSGRGRCILQTRGRTRARAVTPWRERRRTRMCVMMEGAVLL